MDIFLQIFFGTYAGWMISGRDNSMSLGIILGILGAMASSLLMKAFGLHGVDAYNSYSFFVAITGAVTAIHIGRLLQKAPITKPIILNKPLQIIKIKSI